MWLIQSLCLLIRNTFALFSSYVSCCEEERARSIALFLPSLPLFFLPIFLTFFQPYSFVTRVTHTFIHSRSRNPSSSSSGNAITLLSFVGENRIESELFRSVTRIIIIIIRLYHPSICHFVDDRPPRNYLRYVVVKRKRTVVEEKKKGWARDTKVTGRVGDLANLIGHRCFPSRTIDV